MTGATFTVPEIARVCRGTVHGTCKGDPGIIHLLIDSRSLIHPDGCLFIALVSERNDGHKYIPELFEKGVRNFLVSALPQDLPSGGKQDDPYPGAAFILVEDTLKALQELGSFHRQKFGIPVIGVTGSNGKTIVKEWLFQMLNRDHKVIRSPKSYNSQVGVPLSVWKMAPDHDLAIFEAGISKPGEMERLEAVIRPTIGIFTNIGHAHDEYFTGQRQ